MRPIFFLLLLVACTAPVRSEQVLKEAGYTDIHIGGPTLFACSKGDTYNTSFIATSPGGTTATGVVCCGTMKGCTIRL